MPKRRVACARVSLGSTGECPALRPGQCSRRVMKVDREWAQAAATRDLERIVSYWTDDAVIYTPGEAAVAGKEAIRKYVGASLALPGFAISWTPTGAEVSKSGDLGYTIGTNAITLPVARVEALPSKAATSRSGGRSRMGGGAVSSTPGTPLRRRQLPEGR
jgi:ketosteroid isomerase-like protein